MDFLIIITIIIIFILIYSVRINLIIWYNDVQLEHIYRNINLSKLLNNNYCENYSSKTTSIAFITYENRKEKYIDLHDRNIYDYCMLYGYDYIRLDKSYDDISPYWYKIKCVKNMLDSNNWKYIIWLDSDTFINNFNIDIGKILNQYNSDIFVASDNHPLYDIVNAGVFVVKNSNIGKKFMEDWIFSYNKLCYTNNSLKGKWAMSCYEQGQLNKLIGDKYHKNTTLLDNNVVSNKGTCDKNTFIIHYYNANPTDREICFSN